MLSEVGTLAPPLGAVAPDETDVVGAVAVTLLEPPELVPPSLHAVAATATAAAPTVSRARRVMRLRGAEPTAQACPSCARMMLRALAASACPFISFITCPISAPAA